MPCTPLTGSIRPDEIYGSTESGVIACRQRLQDNAPWQPFPGIRFQPQGNTIRLFSPLIADDNGTVIDDILHFNESGQFQLAGRRDRVVKIEEKRISLSEVEYRLLQLDGILEAAVLPITRGSRQSVGALLVLDHDARRRWGKAGITMAESAARLWNLWPSLATGGWLTRSPLIA